MFSLSHNEGIPSVATIFSVECRCDVGVVVYASASCVLEITELELDPERNS